mmetsp:Transcript_28864/g.45460  ORF Transcript_28864/g.45460 Transcript_28864/m.45460 type:complete len:516 (-) Transcript_28864:910-2457(-)
MQTALKRFPVECLVMGWAVFITSLLIIFLTIVGANGRKYLYHEEKHGHRGTSSSGPVIELLAPSKRDDQIKPIFLYEPSSDHLPPPARVVEFYAPWCPHCQHYAPKYIKLAKAVTAKHPEIEFHAVSCTAHNELCNEQNINSYPTLKLFREGSYDALDFKVKDAKVKNVLFRLGFDVSEKSESQNNHEDQSDKKEIARVVPFRMHDVHDAWNDAALSFEFALKTGIFMTNGPLSKEESSSFRKWLELLTKSLPIQMAKTHDIVTMLLANFEEATQSQSNLSKLIRPYASPDNSQIWRTCTNGDNKMGYTCGLWQLFHIMTIGVVEYNRHNTPIIPTRQVSEILRNYVEHFFQCEVCRLNFLDMYDNCAFDGCHRLSDKPSSNEHDWRELPMWLWETHNDVNTRLLGERMDQNNQPKPSQWESQQARWPSLYICPNCWREDKSWEEDEIFDHLHSMYWSGNPSYIKIPNNESEPRKSYRSIWKVGGFLVCIISLLAWFARMSKAHHHSGRHKKVDH